MTKKKQRKGCAKKDAAKTNLEVRRWPGGNLQMIVSHNVQAQEENAILQPLYAILTGLEIKTNGPQGLELLQKINIQDFEQEGKDFFAYSLDHQLSILDFFRLHVAVSGVPLEAEREFRMRLDGDECFFQASFARAGVRYFGSVAGTLGNWAKGLKKREGTLDMPDLFATVLSRYNVKIHLKSINLSKEVTKTAVTCDEKKLWHNLHPREQLFFNDLAECAANKRTPVGEREAYNSQIKISHERIVLDSIAPLAFNFSILYPDGKSIACPLYWGELFDDEDGDVRFWRCQIAKPVSARLFPRAFFALSGVLFGAGREPTVELDGICITVKHGEGIVLTFSAPKSDIMRRLVGAMEEMKSFESLPDERIMLTGVEIDSDAEPYFKERFAVLKGHVEVGGDLWKTREEVDLESDLFRRIDVVSNFASI